MDKSEFLRRYCSPGHRKLTKWFNDVQFAADDSLSLKEESVSPEEIKTYYVLRYEKDGRWDNRPIEKQVDDPGVSLVTVGKTMLDPSAWGLDLKDRDLPSLNRVWAIPVATDTGNAKSLLLDSNHYLVNLLVLMTQAKFEIPIIRICGAHLDRWMVDFKILNRQ